MSTFMNCPLTRLSMSKYYSLHNAFNNNADEISSPTRRIAKTVLAAEIAQEQERNAAGTENNRRKIM